MKKTVLIPCVIISVGILLSCSQTDEKVAARLGEDVITVGMLKTEYLAISSDSRPPLMTIDEKEQFARDVISKEIMVLEARKMGLEMLPEVSETRTAELQRQAWQALYEERVRSKVDVSEAEVMEVLETQGYRYHVGWIFLRSRDLAGKILSRIRAGESFERMASIYSMDLSKEREGDLGSRALGTMPTHVEDIVIQLSPGEVSNVISYEHYSIIVKMYEKEEVEIPDLETARSGLESLVRARKETALQRKIVDDLKSEYGLTFSHDVVDMIVAKTGALYPSEDAETGRIPEFSDEELARAVAGYEGGEWLVRTYVDKMKQQHSALRPGPGVDREMIESIITDIITGELWMLELRSGGYEQRPEVVAAAARESEEALVTALHNELIKGVKVDEEEIKQFYDEQRAELVTDPGVRLAAIALESEEEAEEIYRQIQAGEKFENLARDRSIDQNSGRAGGELPGTLYQQQLDRFPDLQEVVEGLGEGGYSRPMPTPPGFLPGQYSIIKVLEKIPARQLEYEEVKDMLDRRVLQMEQERVFGEWLRQKMEEYNVEIYPDALGPIKFYELKGEEA